ncbi:meiotic recombination [Lithohypha guttulata]|uniref:Double-strand break repair protein n=1 Tax=Lithohypha guttulata TaxID=1690604 RepID=A0AAN7SX60_9EURO|nr:meiotic recombination [Lithohypha guttulata]
MPSQVNGTADTIRILVATDNHVGYTERDPIRGDDSWKTFDEIMTLAKVRDVDMVLLGGDLFHDNVPSRKSMYNVMRSLRLNCYGDKPCELELVSDGTELFDPTIGHANYEDQNINVAIPVFSIHGNHDDPSGEGHLAALDLLEMSGLVNYFGRIRQSDKIDVIPVCLQKGSTKVALYGMSNVRDERMYRTFHDENVAFHKPSIHDDDWYSIAVVHQNHHAHGPTSYLPENFLPQFLDLVIWGHEHECVIEPSLNPQMTFKVMQPGSSVATSLAPGEAVPKHVAILSITGKNMKCEPIKLKTVRPFVYKEIVLGMNEKAKAIAEKPGHRHRLTEWLMKQVDDLIDEANQQWEADREEDGTNDEQERPLPLIRLRVEHGSIEGFRFELENPQRFSNRFSGRVANNHDVVQFYIKKRTVVAARTKASEELKQLMDRPETAESVKVSKLVAEFLSAQSLTILPQNYFGDAVNQYIEKDDKHAMDLFVDDSLSKQIQAMVDMNAEQDEMDDDMTAGFSDFRARLEEQFMKGEIKRKAGDKSIYKPKPPDYDSEMDGPWEEQAAACITVGADKDGDAESDNDSDATPKPAHAPARGRGRGRGARGGTTSTRARGGAAVKKTTASRSSATTSTRGKGRKKIIEEESEEEDANSDIIMLDDDDGDDEDAASPSIDSDSQAMFFPEVKSVGSKPTATTNGSARGSRAGSQTNNTTASKPATKSAVPVASTRKPAARAAAARSNKQSTLSFTNSQASVFGNGGGGGRSQRNVSDIEDDDDDDEDAFEPATMSRKSTRSQR